jgi:hypothetical protein
MVASESTHLLVDPLLSDGVGRGRPDTRQRFLLYPPRRYHRQACPPIDALIISHEHEDHFNIPSFLQIDRAVPVYLSARSSIAARTILDEMGFQVVLAYPGEPFRVGDIDFRFMTPVHESDQGDEWDTLAYLFERPGDGSFFSNVDIGITPTMEAAVAAAPEPRLLYTGMALSLWKEGFARPEKSSEMHRPPSGVTVSADPLSALRALERVQVVPGQTVTLSGGALVSAEPRSDFLDSPPVAEWGPRLGFWPSSDEPLVPLTPPRDLDDAELAELQELLDRMAQFMYGGPLFRALYSIDGAKLGGIRPTVALVLHTTDEESAIVYEYQPETCGFMPLDELGDHVGLVRSYAGDFLAMLRNEFEPRCLSKQVRERWHETAPNVSFFTSVLWMYLHPLRHPERVLARYRAQLAEEPRPEILFHRRR